MRRQTKVEEDGFDLDSCTGLKLLVLLLGTVLFCCAAD